MHRYPRLQQKKEVGGGHLADPHFRLFLSSDAFKMLDAIAQFLRLARPAWKNGHTRGSRDSSRSGEPPDGFVYAR